MEFAAKIYYTTKWEHGAELGSFDTFEQAVEFTKKELQKTLENKLISDENKSYWKSEKYFIIKKVEASQVIAFHQHNEIFPVS